MFAIHLALHCGEWDVDGMLDRMTPQQFDELHVAYQIEPWGDGRADIRSGLAAAALCQMWGAEDVTPGDFMMFVEKPPQSVELQKSICTTAAAAQNASQK